MNELDTLFNDGSDTQRQIKSNYNSDYSFNELQDPIINGKGQVITDGQFPNNGAVPLVGQI